MTTFVFLPQLHNFGDQFSEELTKSMTWVINFTLDNNINFTRPNTYYLETFVLWEERKLLK